jgi:hypothetical protein
VSVETVVYDLSMPCLCCNKPGLVASKDWNNTEAPVALCPDCFRTVPRAMVRVLYLMRSQIKMLFDKQELQERDIKRLFSAQREMEQELLAQG